jgi:hypothetical protein
MKAPTNFRDTDTMLETSRIGTATVPHRVMFPDKGGLR